MSSKKLFIGRKLRQIREEEALTQARFAAVLGISTSYLNQIENNQRHVTAPVIIALAEKFAVDIASLSDSDADRLLADLMEVFKDPLLGDAQPSHQELKLTVNNSPDVARSVILLHQKLRRANDVLTEMGDAVTSRGDGRTAFDEVRDYFHYKDNYIDELDRAAELMAERFGGVIKAADLERYIQGKYDIQIEYDPDMEGRAIRGFERASNKLKLNAALSDAGRKFQLALQIGILDHIDLINGLIEEAGFQSEDSIEICRLSLSNYFAGAFVMPYEMFRQKAIQLRHDIHLLANHFNASIEQVCHRLSTLQRLGSRGVPFFFARVDQAGNITKRHSATQLQFARFGAACPLWNVHQAFERPGEILRQLAETPDGVKYLCLAISISKRNGGFKSPVQRYALALGCEISQAKKIVYADDMAIDLETSYEPIGVSCRLCERLNCIQRSVPPLGRQLSVDLTSQKFIPYQIR